MTTPFSTVAAEAPYARITRQTILGILEEEIGSDVPLKVKASAAREIMKVIEERYAEKPRNG